MRRPIPALGLTAAILVAAAGPAAAQTATPPAPQTLYRLQMLQAAPGRLLELIDVVKRHAALATAGGEAAPVIMRHSQGDHWDLAVLWPMDDWDGVLQPGARGEEREAAAKASGPPAADVERELDPLVSWHEDLYVRGPSVEALRAHVKDTGLLHYEMMQALPGSASALIEERRMENAFNRNRGRGETLIFVREAGAAWDVVTLGVYRNWTQYAESDLISEGNERRGGAQGRLHRSGRRRALHANADFHPPRHAGPADQAVGGAASMSDHSRLSILAATLVVFAAFPQPAGRAQTGMPAAGVPLGAATRPPRGDRQRDVDAETGDRRRRREAARCRSTAPGSSRPRTASPPRPIEVPGEWAMQGFEVPAGGFATYTREVEVPADWGGKTVKLRFDAVHCGLRGPRQRPGGRRPRGRLRAVRARRDEGDPRRAGTRFAVRVQSESIADSVSCISQYAAHQVGGLIRKVTLFAVPQVFVSKLWYQTAVTGPDARVVVHTDVAPSVAGATPRVQHRLLDPSGRRVAAVDRRRAAARQGGPALDARDPGALHPRDDAVDRRKARAGPAPARRTARDPGDGQPRIRERPPDQAARHQPARGASASRPQPHARTLPPRRRAVPRGQRESRPDVALPSQRGVPRRVRRAGHLRRERGGHLLGPAWCEPLLEDTRPPRPEVLPVPSARHARQHRGPSHAPERADVVARQRVAVDAALRQGARAREGGGDDAAVHVPRSDLGRLQQRGQHAPTSRTTTTRARTTPTSGASSRAPSGSASTRISSATTAANW